MRERSKKFRYVAHLTVRVPHGYVTVKVVGSKYLTAYVGVVGRVPNVPKFGPWPPWVNILKSLLSAPGIVQVEGETYPLRSLLASLGYWFDRKSGVYRRASPELQIADGGEPVDFYAEVGF